MKTNVVFHGEILDILRRYIFDKGIDLVYRDPLFNSSQSHDAIFNDESGRGFDAQLPELERVERKRADRGIDGRITVTRPDKRLESVLVSVYSGHVNSAKVWGLAGTVAREKAAMGIFLTLEEPTREMQREATTAGMYRVWEKDYPRLQILTIRELLEERRKPALPPLVLPTFQPAERLKARGGEQLTIDEAEGA